MFALLPCMPDRGIKMKRKLLVNVFAYGLIWLLVAGLNLLAGRFLGRGLDWWFVTMLAGVSAFGDWFGGWLKSRQQHENLSQEGASRSAPTQCE